jgi:subtilisin family serine protease
MHRSVPSLALLLIAGLIAGSGQLQQPDVTRLDPMLVRAVAKMEQLARTTLITEIPSLARSAGVYAGPAGPSDPWAEVIVRGYGTESAVQMAGGIVGSRLGEVVTARLPLSQVYRLADSPGVEFVEASTLMYPTLDTSVPEIGVDILHGGGYNLKGDSVLVAIYDSGIDFTHDDFRNSDGTTRIVAIWDQTDNSGSPPSGYVDGSEWTQAQIDAELITPGTVTQVDVTGHGTHVAGIAAGNGLATGGGQDSLRHVGVAPEADILVIKGGDDVFQSADVLDGVAYAFAKAASLGLPMVVNLSLGGHTGSHDGLSAYEQGLDAQVGTGQVIVIAAGNEGSMAVHGQTTVTSISPVNTIQFDITDYTPEVGADNDKVSFDIWYESSANVSVMVTAPGNTTYGPYGWSTALTVNDQSEGAVEIQSGSGGAGLDNRMILEVRDETVGQEPANGTWTLTFDLTIGSTATVDLWIYETSFGGTQRATVTGGTPDYAVAIPGTAIEPITVGSYVTKHSWTAFDALTYSYLGSDRTADYSTFSSWGPSRDGRTKPEITAPGQGIMSALSLDMFYPGDSWVDLDGVHRLSQGTSQAAPHVTGVVALMLQSDDTLTNAAIKGHLISSARSDGFTGSLPNPTWGHGKLDGKAAVDSASGGGDTTGPGITIGIHRNSVLTNYLDLYFFPDEPLTGPPDVDVEGTVVSMATISTSEGALYVGDFRIPTDGSYTITAVADDLFANQSTVTRTFSTVLVTNELGGHLLSSDGMVSVAVSPGSVDRDGYLVLTRLDEDAPHVVADAGPENVLRKPSASEAGFSPAYALLPENGTLRQAMRLEFAYNPADLRGTDPLALGIYRWDGGTWQPVESYVDVRRQRVEATVDRLGIYRLQASDAAAEIGQIRTALHPNYPNPFNGGTQVRFTLARPAEAELFVLNVRGQRVRTLVSGIQPAGGHVITWDGRGPSGQRLASGVYLLVLRVEGRVFTRKALLLQ